MRDPNRIPEMVDVLQKLWEKYPDQRLGQLLINAASLVEGPSPEWPDTLFQIEDDAMLRGLLRFEEDPPSNPPRDGGSPPTA